jgi:hypothetical protein
MICGTAIYKLHEYFTELWYEGLRSEHEHIKYVVLSVVLTDTWMTSLFINSWETDEYML